MAIAENDADEYANENGRKVRMVEFLNAVAHLGSHAIDGILGADDHNAVSHLQTKVAFAEEVQVATPDAGHVHAIHAGEVHLTQCLTVHAWVGNDDTS